MEKIYDIVTDGDDVLIQSMKAFNRFHNKKYNRNFTISDYTTFDVCKLWGISKEQFFIDEVEFYESDFYNEVEEEEGGYEVVECLSQSYNVRVVTGRGIDVAHHLPVTLAKLYAPDHFASIDHVGSAHNSNLLVHKWEKCKLYNAPLMIDDYPGHLLNAAENGIHGILLSKPWNNRIRDLPKNIDRARNLHEVLEIIMKKRHMLF
jgi:uncharacterized HAD superfamily protein